MKLISEQLLRSLRSIYGGAVAQETLGKANKRLDLIKLVAEEALEEIESAEHFRVVPASDGNKASAG